MISFRTSHTSIRRRMRAGIFVYAAIVAACHRQAATPAPVPAPTRAPAPKSVAISNGQTLIRAMHEKYAPAWYHTLTFVQKTTVSRTAKDSLVQTWYEAGEFPGRLRIDTDLSGKSGVLYSHDSTYSFVNDKAVRADTGYNELLVLGFDVYTEPVERSVAVLRHLGFDLNKFHERTWQGKPVYVVGASRGDTTSKQFWVTRDELLFVREITPTARGRADYRFNRYEKFGGGWVATEVEQIINGHRAVLEQYSNIRTNVPLAEAVFDPSRWSTAPHWFKQP